MKLLKHTRIRLWQVWLKFMFALPPFEWSCGPSSFETHSVLDLVKICPVVIEKEIMLQSLLFSHKGWRHSIPPNDKRCPHLSRPNVGSRSLTGITFAVRPMSILSLWSWDLGHNPICLFLQIFERVCQVNIWDI